MRSYRRRSLVNDQIFTKLEKHVVIPTARLTGSDEEIHHQRDASRDMMTSHDFRSRSNTVPARLPSHKPRNVKLKSSKQRELYSEFERFPQGGVRGHKKYLKPLTKQNKIPADALEDPLASSGRTEGRNTSLTQNPIETELTNGISSLDIFDYSERHSFNHSRRNQKRHSTEIPNNITEEFRPRASTLSPTLLRKISFSKSNSEIQSLTVNTANQLHHSSDRLPALRTGTDQPLHSILKHSKETAIRTAWTEPLPGISPIPIVRVSDYDIDEPTESKLKEVRQPGDLSRSMFNWKSQNSPQELTLDDAEDAMTSSTSSMTSSKRGLKSQLPRGSDTLNAVLRELNRDDVIRPEIAITESKKLIGQKVTQIKHVHWPDTDAEIIAS